MLNIGQGRRDLLVCLTGRMVSTFGDGVALVALILRLEADGARPYEVSLLIGAGGIPLVLFSRLVGRLVDTHDSRDLLVGARLIEVACTVPLIVMHSMTAILALVALLGAAASVSATTWSALVPYVVGEDHVAEAVSAQQSLNAIVLVGAPVVGGLLAGAFGSGLPLAIDAVTFVVVTGAAASVRTRRRAAGLGTDARSDRAQSGIEILRADRVLAPLTVGLGLVVALVGTVNVVLVFLVRATLHAGGVWYGTAEAAWMAGMVAGSLGAGRVTTERLQTWATLAGAGVACAALIPFAVVTTAWMLVPLSILGGLGNGYAGASYSTLLVSRTPDSARGRVSAAASAVLGGAQGVSLLVGGTVAAVLSPRAIYAAAGLFGLAAAVAMATGHAARDTSSDPPVLPRSQEPLSPPLSRTEVFDVVGATLVGRASRLTRLLMKSGTHELTRTEIGVLTSLVDAPRRITELAETEAVAQPTMSNLVDRLEGRGLVARRRSSGDGRAVLVSISAEGQRRLEAARTHIRSLLRHHLVDLDDDELAALVAAGEVLERLIGMLQRGDVDA